jgi:hypothetical protein
MAQITFTNISGAEIEKPEPASRFIPDWYKNMESYIGGEKKPTGNGQTNATIKRCMPVFDAITAGYIITSYVDIYISQKPSVDAEGKETGQTLPWYEWPSFQPLEWHPVIQAPTYPNKNSLLKNSSYPKWNNPWSIKTPKGYSTWFTAPKHRESIFTILDGVVDTDTYSAPVNFPFVLNDWNFEGFIPAGTPIAQVIPFKRESWEMKFGDHEEYIAQQNTITKLRIKFFDSYKSQFRQVKEYN